MRPGTSPPPPRSAAVDLAAAILVFGGLFGITALFVGGDSAITGSLPAKLPIVGVALIMYVASAALGVTIRLGRFWFPALNLAGLFAVLYLLAAGRLLNVVLGLAYVVAFAILLVHRRWFAAFAPGRPRPRR